MLPVDEIRLNFNPASLAVLNAVLAFLMFGISLDTSFLDHAGRPVHAVPDGRVIDELI